MSYKRPVSEPIAIVGSSCRFAGGATSPSKLWEVLSRPTDLSREIPPERFSIKGFYHPDGHYHGTTNSPKAYFLEQNHRVFDAAFFNITPKEAEAIDPQQRILLEVVYAALESAGYTLQQHAGKNVAVFAGLMTADYDTLSQRDDLATSQYYATGNARSILSNRVSYFFNFNGPSMTIDTACSSSLVALHQAVLSLRSGECEMACVTGANLILTPEQFIVESSLNMLSPSGHCRMWDSKADGYARGEGVAAMFIKPLSKALADGDCIEAVIRETGVNSDGRSKGITMPNWEAQSALIRDTYRRAGLDPSAPEDRCQYFEAHGTGTSAGDPNEARAIDYSFFPENAPKTPKLLVGSVKTVIGHTEGAAGLAGLLKVLQAMRHGSVPPNLHLEMLNPEVEKYCNNLVVPTRTVPWPRVPAGQPKRASVNSFGFGGTNAHAIVEEYSPDIHDEVAERFQPELLFERGFVLTEKANSGWLGARVCLPLLMSANSQKSLAMVARKYHDYLTEHPATSCEVMAWNSCARRTEFPFRTHVSGSSVDELIHSLESLVGRTDQEPSSAAIGTRVRQGAKKILGVFTGQGAQWATMSRGLLMTSQVYREVIKRLDKALQGCKHPPSWSLEREILADERFSGIQHASISQPLCTALQIGMVELLQSLGIRFDAVVGHSSGEIAAAYAAGRLDMEDAILISYYRGLYAHLASGATGAKGGMLAAGLSHEEAVELCSKKEYSRGICIAANNAPSSVTLSGDLDVVQQVHDELSRQQKFARMLKVDTAYHSPHMERPAEKYLEALAQSSISPTEGRVGCGARWVSSVYPSARPNKEELKGSYWKDNMVRPVLFYEAIEAALETLGPFDYAIEVGPHPALKGPVTQVTKAKAGAAIPYTGVLERKVDDRVAFADFLGWTWSQFGYANIREFVRKSAQPDLVDCRLKDLPSYPWDHSQEHYRESRVSRQYHFRTHGPHELLGVRTRDDTQYELRWRNILKLKNIPWVKHHSFQGQALLPASAYCVMALDAVRVMLADRTASTVELQDLEFPTGIIIEPDSHGVEILCSLAVVPTTGRGNRSQSRIEATFTIASAIADGTTTMKKNFSCTVHVALGEKNPRALPPRPKDRAETLYANTEAFYDMIAGTGLVYSGPFKGLRTLERRFKFSSGTAQKLHPEDTTGLSISPATLDSCLQSAFASFTAPVDNALWTSFLPLRIDRVRFNMAICDIANADDMLAVDTYLTRVTPTTRGSATSFTADVNMFNQQGEMEIQVEGLTVGSFTATSPEDDYELYLTTVMDMDPEDEIISMSVSDAHGPSPTLIESCERVASFFMNTASTRRLSEASSRVLSPYAHNVDPQAQVSSWPEETLSTLEHFIRASPYSTTLEFVRRLSKDLPDVLAGMLPTVVEEAHQLEQFQKHFSRVTRQIAHKYPRMNVLGLTDPEMSLTEYALAGLGNAFLTYRVGTDPEKNLADRVPATESLRRKLMIDLVDLGADPVEVTSAPQYDLVVLNTGVVEKRKMHRVMTRVKQMMRPGGFLILIHVSQSSLKDRIRQFAGFRADADAIPTSPDWPDILDECGFVNSIRSSTQYYPSGISLIVRQAESQEKQILLRALANPTTSPLTERLLIVGGKRTCTSMISSGVCQSLVGKCGGITTVETLDNIPLAMISSFSAAIVLQDLDEPILANMTATRMDVLRELLRPEMVILWVTHNARLQNPDQAASFGFARTMLAETPSLILQMLDLDILETLAAVNSISKTFARLAMHYTRIGAKENNRPLWTYEPEIHIEHGRRVVPRVLPWKQANNRVNAFRRLVSETLNTLETSVDVVLDGASVREIKALYPRDGACVLNWLPESSELSETLLDTLPKNCDYFNLRNALPSASSHIHSINLDENVTGSIWDVAVTFALSRTETWPSDVVPALMSVPDLLEAREQTPPFQLLDWRVERSVSRVIKPSVEARLGANKTYHGARNIVLASRNPPKQHPKWQDELVAQGINVRFEALDVTQLDRVRDLEAKLAKTMPPVAGIVNGAMVLDDRIFSQMTVETLHRVMNPKTVGSKNLDMVFNSPDLDFFVMTSSFAAIGGHAGQSNYAAANMYMNGLAASRRRRGLPGSVLNIGVIYGLGFLHREKDDLYQGLEREGYPPISERDLHHMFLEAIVAGRPDHKYPVHDITTGLRRYPADRPTLHWHQDPRFSHYTREEADVDETIAGGGPKQSIKELLDAAGDRTEIVNVLVSAFASHLKAILQLPDDTTITGDHSIAELGVDSLVATEIRSWVWKAAGKDLAVMKILGGSSISKCKCPLPVIIAESMIDVWIVCGELADAIVAGRANKAAKKKETTNVLSLVVDQTSSPSSTSSVSEDQPSTPLTSEHPELTLSFSKELVGT
ncbi:hypothetical protein QBC46DRAFT_318963 [Diplogelasinospora grovesii]|uniref:Polyketide synthase n=1 Tax=Diplogelasinospora grovesii TaxID=303347 RepID=A0AAN6N3A7_9PEZI|nr:hypothetical protein QBC46DRAFT_318963 [Diplogelasinospora grovesii]